MGIDDMPGDRESQARATCLAGSCGIDAVETFKDALQVGLRNSDARVGDRENDVVAVGTRLDLNLSAGGCVLQRIVQQILQHFAKLCAISANGRRVFLQVDRNLQSSGSRVEARRLNAAIDEGLHTNGTDCE